MANKLLDHMNAKLRAAVESANTRDELATIIFDAYGIPDNWTASWDEIATAWANEDDPDHAAANILSAANTRWFYC